MCSSDLLPAGQHRAGQQQVGHGRAEHRVGMRGGVGQDVYKRQPVTFDLDVLRSFVAGVELGSFGRAADRLGRSTSAVSAQLKKLEEQAGVPLLRKAGRGLALTDAGETMLAYARRLLELNDQASVAVRGTRLQGRVRLGLQEDFGEILLPQVLGQFARAHPQMIANGIYGI